MIATATSAFGVCWWVVPVGEVGFVTLWPVLSPNSIYTKAGEA